MSTSVLVASTIFGNVIISDMYKTNTILMKGDSRGALKANYELFLGYDEPFSLVLQLHLKLEKKLFLKIKQIYE